VSAVAVNQRPGDFARFEEKLRQQRQSDPRLASGAPRNWRGDELAFIRLTGMTRPPAAGRRPQTPVSPGRSEAAQGFREIIEMLGGVPVA
jgi:hypothetical protein